MKVVNIAVAGSLFWALLAWAAPSNYLLVSTIEQPMIPKPVNVYALDVQAKRLDLVETVPSRKSVRLVSVYPEVRKIAVWGYSEGDSGYLAILDADMPQDKKIIGLPKMPILGGYLVKTESEEYWFASWGFEKEPKSSHLFAYSLANNSLDEKTTVAWETASISGSDALRPGGGRTLNLKVDFATGQFTHYVGAKTFQLSWCLDKASLEELNRFKTRAHQIMVNDARVIVMTCQEVVPVPGTGQLLIFVYNKSSKRWWHTKLAGSWSRVKTAGKWIVVQQVQPKFGKNETISHEDQVTGKYSFFSSDGSETFVWNADGTTEILSISGNSLLFRNRDAIYSAVIDTSGVRDQNLLIRDEVVENMHWALACSDE